MWSAALFLILAQATSQPRLSLRPASYLPLVPGTVWVYQSSQPGDALWEVTASGISAGESLAGAWLFGYFPGPPRLVRSLASGVVEEVSAEGPSVLWYQLHAPEGNSWTLKLAGDTGEPILACYQGARLRVAGRGETVVVPAGTFTQVVQVRWETPCADAGPVAEWFAPGVGLVQRQEQTLWGVRTWQLRELRRDGPLVPDLPRYGGGVGLVSRQLTLNLMPPVDLSQLPTVKGSLALWYLPATAEGSREEALPPCLVLVGEILDSRGQVLLRQPLVDPGCTALTPVGSRLRVIPFALPTVVQGRPLAQGSYQLRLQVVNPGWQASFSLPFLISHLY
ncbi:MAG: hypothetical protein N2447_06695 [Thermoanaerobaculum sp.]|nr:hypothetical protein [Thermoanaerobaculum sp.]